jgi:hypothetical protein
MDLILSFAHAEELHTQSTSGLVHTITEPAVAVPLYILVLLISFYGLKTYKKSLLLPVMLILNFCAGIAFYSLVPTVSIIGITLGIMLALVVALGSIVAN